MREKIEHFLSEQYELFWPVDDENSINARGYVEEIDAETISERCEVIFLPSLIRCHEKIERYCIRYGFTIRHKLVSDKELVVHLSLTGKDVHLNLKTPVRGKTNSRELPNTSQGRNVVEAFIAVETNYM